MNHDPDDAEGIDSLKTDDAVDDLARRAGASLRRPASE